MGIESSMSAHYAHRATIHGRVYAKPERQADLRAMAAWLPTAPAGRRGLELACGTGWWTPHGAHHALSWLATDINPETMALARAKALPACVQFATVDAYAFAGLEGRRFNAAFAGCWWSHVPLARLPGWLDTRHAHLELAARVVMLDNSDVRTSNLPITRHDDAGNPYQTRTLDDGSVHEGLKNFPTREQALAMLDPRAHSPEWIEHDHDWVPSYLLQ